MTQTAISNAMKRAGFNTTEYELRQVAQDVLKKHHRNIDRAVPTFLKSLSEKRALMEAALKIVLRQFDKEMHGLPDGGQVRGATQLVNAPARQSNGTGQWRRDAHSQPAGAGNGSGQLVSDTRHATAGTKANTNGAGLSTGAHHATIVRPVREPSASYRAIAKASMQAEAKTILDTYKVRDGRAIGDVRYGEIERMRTEDAMAASVWRQIQRAHPNAPHDMKVRDIVKIEELQRMIQKAAEVADAA